MFCVMVYFKFLHIITFMGICLCFVSFLFVSYFIDYKIINRLYATFGRNFCYSQYIV